MATYVEPGCCGGGSAAVFPEEDFERLDESNQKLVKSADAGDIESCFHTGKNLIEGSNGFPVMLNLGENYLLKSVKKDHVESLIYYASLLSKGDRLPRDDKKAQKNFRRAAKKGSSEAHVRIGQYWKDEEIDYKKAAKEFQTAVKQKNPEAMLELAYLHKEGLGVSRSESDAVRLYKSAAELGYAKGINAYAACLRSGSGCTKDSVEAAKLYRANADRGDGVALFALAQMLENGEGVDRNIAEAAACYRSAANNGNSDAMYRYSHLLLRGEGVEQNETAAVETLRNAASYDHPAAMYEWSQRLFFGNGVDKDEKSAEDYCKRAAIKGNVDAEFFYGHMLQDMEQYDQSFSYMTSAANKGHVEARLRCAYMRLTGCGAKIDFKAAHDLFAGLENETKAILGIGIMHENGYFVQQDYNEALNRYRCVKERGEYDGLAHEAVLVRNGWGCKQDVKEAQNMLQNAAENGSIFGKLQLAIMAMEKTPKDAAEVFQEVADQQKDSLARERIAFCFLNGVGVKKDTERAIYYYRMSAKQGNKDSLFTLGSMLLTGNCIEMNKREGISLLQKAAKLGHMEAHSIYGWALLHGDGCTKCGRKAIKHTKIAALHDNVTGMAYYGAILYNGLAGIMRDYEEAQPFIIKASEAGHPDAMDIYGQMLEKGEGMAQDLEKAVHLFSQATELGNIDAAFHYAQCLEKGRGCEADLKKAAHFYKIAADSSNIEATFIYATFLDEGRGITQDYKEAATYYLAAATHEHVDAMANYAVLLHDGKGVKKNVKEALKWNKKAADLGNTKAMNNAAHQLLNGEGCFKKPKEALKYLEQSAAKQDPTGLFMLGGVYERGDGVEANMFTAAGRYKEAAEKGQEEAMFRVAALMLDGQFTDKDSVQAYAYYKTLADKGHLLSCVKFAEHLEATSNLDEAAHYFKAAADGQNPDGLYNYGRLLLDGRGVEKNEATGVGLIKKAADEHKYGKACTRYGTIIQTAAFGVKKNEKAAIKYFQTAIDVGDSPALHHYAAALENGKGCKKDLKKAMNFFEKSSKSGSAYAADDEQNFYRLQRDLENKK